MVGLHHWLNGHEFQQTLGDGEGEGSLACCSPRSHKESDRTEWLNNNNILREVLKWVNDFILFFTGICILIEEDQDSGIGSNLCQLSWRWYLTISSSLVPFSSYLQSFPASGSFPMSHCSHQVTKAAASASVLPMNILGWFPLGLTALISLLSEGLSRVFSSITVWKHQFFSIQPSLWSLTSLHDYHKVMYVLYY